MAIKLMRVVEPFFNGSRILSLCRKEGLKLSTPNHQSNIWVIFSQIHDLFVLVSLHLKGNRDGEKGLKRCKQKFRLMYVGRIIINRRTEV